MFHVTSHAKRDGVVALFFVAVIYAFFGVISRFLTPEFGNIHQLWVRALAAAAFCCVIPRFRISFRDLSRLPLREWRTLLIRSSAIYPLGALLWIEAIQSAPLGTVAFISALPLEGIWGRFLYKQEVTLPQWGWVLVSLVGLWLVCDPKELHIGFGETCALFSALLFSFGVASRRSHLGILNNGQITFLLCRIGTIEVAAIGFAVGDPFPHHASFFAWSVAISSGALIAFNFWLLNRGFEVLSSVAGGGLLMLECVFAPVFGYYFFSELLPGKVFFGGALIALSSVGLLYVPKTRRA